MRVSHEKVVDKELLLRAGRKIGITSNTSISWIQVCAESWSHCIQSHALRSDLAPISFLEAASYDETPMTVRTTDDVLDLEHVLEESAETSRAFAVAACGPRDHWISTSS